MAPQQVQIPSINFNDLDPNQPNGSNWEETRIQVFSALETYGCFNAIYYKVGSELKDALFGSVVPNIFALPLEKKQMFTSIGTSPYFGKFTDVSYESFPIKDADNTSSVEKLAHMLYPEGNELFSNTVSSYVERVCTLEQMVERMIFQSLGIDKHWDSHHEKLVYGVRIAMYGDEDLHVDEAKVSLPAHVDHNMMSIVHQNEVEGLEVLTKDGDWTRVIPSPDSCTVIIGASLKVLSNGRLRAPFHRVSVNRKRYGAVLASFPKEGHLIEVPKEIIDESHPLKYNSFDVRKYFRFQCSPEGLQAEDPLKDFCGVLEE